MSSPPVLEVKYFSGKCQGCKRTLTEAVAPSLSNCLCARPRIPQLGDLLEAGSGGREVTYRVATGSRENVAAALTGDRANPNPSNIPSSPRGLSGRAGSAAVSPSVSGFRTTTNNKKRAATGSVCLQACLLVQKCCDLLMETGKMREENANVMKKINNSKENIEFKCC